MPTEAELRRESSGDLSGREISTATMAARAPAVMPAFMGQVCSRRMVTMSTL